MHFAIQKEILVQCLKEVGNALPARSVQPILSHIDIQSVDESTILFRATDLDLFISSKANAVVYAPGSVALPGKKLLEIVSKLPDDLVSFQTNKETQETSIQCAKTKISLSGLAHEDFPSTGELSGDGVLLPADILRTSIAQTSFAAASFDTGSVIGGVYMSINNGEFECVATDGNRLAYRQQLLSLASPAKTSAGAKTKTASMTEESSSVATMEKPLSLKAIIPARACNEILMLIDAQSNRAKRSAKTGGENSAYSGDIRISMNSGMISFQTESNTMSTRTISGEYPAFKELFPTQCKYIAILNRQELSAALDRVAVMADEKKHLIRFHFEGETMQITANTPDFGHAQDEVQMKFEGQVLDIAVNVRYLLDVLRCANSQEVTIEMNGTLQPMIIKEKDSESYKYLLMPVELKMA